MASTYTANTGLEKIASGEQAGTWGNTTNANFDIIDDALNGVLSITVTGATTLTTSDGVLSNGHHKVIVLAGTPSSAFNLTIAPNDVQKYYFIKNNSGQTATVLQGGGSGDTVALANGAGGIIFADGSGANANVATISTDVLGDTTPQLGGNLDVNTKNINFGDAATAGSDDTLQFGASQDLKIFHDGSNSQIRDSGTGALKIGGSQVDIVSDDAGESMATFVDNGAATLFFDNSAKLATVTGGISVTGAITIGSATIDETELEILDGATVTTTELNIMDGGATVGTTAFSDGDGLVTNDDGTMQQTSAATLSTYMNANAFAAPSAISSTSTLTPGSAKSIYQRVDTSGGSITLTVAVGSLTVGQYVVVDKTSTSNSLSLTWANNSQGVSLGNDVDIAVGFYNGTAFSFIETIKA